MGRLTTYFTGEIDKLIKELLFKRKVFHDKPKVISEIDCYVAQLRALKIYSKLLQ